MSFSEPVDYYYSKTEAWLYVPAHLITLYQHVSDLLGTRKCQTFIDYDTTVGRQWPIKAKTKAQFLRRLKEIGIEGLNGVPPGLPASDGE
jgi:hypothetical protein